MTDRLQSDVSRPWPIPVRPWLWRTLMLVLIGVLAVPFLGWVLIYFLDGPTSGLTSLDDLPGIAIDGAVIVLLTMTLSRRGIGQIRRAGRGTVNTVAKIIAPIVDPMVEPAVGLLARLLTVVLWLLLALVPVGVFLAILYGLVRFVKWAWN